MGNCNACSNRADVIAGDHTSDHALPDQKLIAFTVFTRKVKDNKIVVRRDWKTDADKIKGAFAIARDLAEHVIAKEKTAKKAKAKG